jgi:hypothetical protein
MDLNSLDSTDQSALQSILGGSTPSLIPESLVTTLTVGFIVLNVLGILFFVFYVISMIRKWKVESAVLHMQKDLAAIKASLEQPSVQPAAQPAPVTPGRSSEVIAHSDASSDSSSSLS